MGDRTGGPLSQGRVGSGAWMDPGEIQCRGCRRIIDRDYTFCPWCGLWVQKKPTQIYRDPRVNWEQARRFLRGAFFVLLEMAWTAFVFLVGLSAGRAGPG